MRVVVQRVNNASVSVEGKTKENINKGLLIFLGVCEDDTESDINYLAEKITNLRIFEDDSGKMNLSLKNIGGELLIISQFTLFGDCRKGRRPSFDKAGKPEYAKKIYNLFIEKCEALNLTVKQGVFGADMQVILENDGPVTLLLDSKKLF